MFSLLSLMSGYSTIESKYSIYTKQCIIYFEKQIIGLFEKEIEEKNQMMQ